MAHGVYFRFERSDGRNHDVTVRGMAESTSTSSGVAAAVADVGWWRCVDA